MGYNKHKPIAPHLLPVQRAVSFPPSPPPGLPPLPVQSWEIGRLHLQSTHAALNGQQIKSSFLPATFWKRVPSRSNKLSLVPRGGQFSNSPWSRLSLRRHSAPFPSAPAPLTLHSSKKQWHVNWLQSPFSEEPQLQLGAVFRVPAITMWTNWSQYYEYCD